jgi:tetratricopeptide (TPR) repeat protein
MKKVFHYNIIPFFLILSLGGYFLIQQNLTVKRENYLNQSYMGYTLPSKISGLAALEFKGILSDFLFLKVSTFLGDKFIKREMLADKHADYIYNSVDVITDLDPWFWDAYLFADLLLTWDFKKIDMANKLLFKAREYRTNDFKVPYHIGFNYFYFLKDNMNGAKYMMEAASLPGSPTWLNGLGTRLSVYQNQYKPAIMFLSETLKKTHNPALAKQMEIRLNTLIALDKLEKAVQEYKKIFGFLPLKITDLIDKGFVKTIPQDTNGGECIIQKNGRVFTTSNMIHKQKKSN